MRRDMRLAEALAILKHYRMPYAFEKGVTLNEDGTEEGFNRYSWDGETVAVSPFSQSDHLLHELGHWLACAKRRLHLPEFGLGTSFRSHKSPAQTIEAIDKDENQACAFEIGAYWKLGFNWRKIARAVSWDGTEGRTWEEYIDKFEEAREPVELLRSKRIFQGYAPKDLPSLDDLATHTEHAEEEIEEWKNSHSWPRRLPLRPPFGWSVEGRLSKSSKATPVTTVERFYGAVPSALAAKRD